MKYDIPSQHRWEDPPQRIGEPDLGILPSGILFFIDTYPGSYNKRYVNQFVQGLPAPAWLRFSSTVDGKRPITRSVGKAAPVASGSDRVSSSYSDDVR